MKPIHPRFVCSFLLPSSAYYSAVSIDSQAQGSQVVPKKKERERKTTVSFPNSPPTL